MGNNPVNYVDPTGHFAIPLVYLAGAALVAAAVSLTPSVQEGLHEMGARFGSWLSSTIHGHHPWPKYLGGDKNQPLVDIPAADHIDLHKGIDEFAPRWKGKDYYDNLTQAEKEEILRLLKDFYKDRCPKCLEELERQLGEGGASGGEGAGGTEGESVPGMDLTST